MKWNMGLETYIKKINMSKSMQLKNEWSRKEILCSEVKYKEKEDQMQITKIQTDHTQNCWNFQWIIYHE
jgi:hypothetical protein